MAHMCDMNMRPSPPVPSCGTVVANNSSTTTTTRTGEDTYISTTTLHRPLPPPTKLALRPRQCTPHPTKPTPRLQHRTPQLQSDARHQHTKRPSLYPRKGADNDHQHNGTLPATPQAYAARRKVHDQTPTPPPSPACPPYTGTRHARAPKGRTRDGCLNGAGVQHITVGTMQRTTQSTTRTLAHPTRHTNATIRTSHIHRASQFNNNNTH